jgi:hypothetical protein
VRVSYSCVWVLCERDCRSFFENQLEERVLVLIESVAAAAVVQGHSELTMSCCPSFLSHLSGCCCWSIRFGAGYIINTEHQIHDQTSPPIVCECAYPPLTNTNTTHHNIG